MRKMITHVVRSWKKSVHWIGFFLMLASLAFVWEQFRRQAVMISDWHLDFKLIVIILFSIMAYGFASYLLAFGWAHVMSYFGSEKICDTSDLNRVYARSQIAKYLPGNIVHLLTRHALLHANGSGHRQLGKAAIYEIIGLITSALAIACSVSFWILVSNKFGFWLALASLPALLLAVSWLVNKVRFVFLQRSHLMIYKPQVWKYFKALLVYALFFLICSILFWSLISFLNGTFTPVNPNKIITTYVIAWVVGFVVVGAPAGIGVRESVIVYMLRDIVPAGDAVLAAMLFRGVTLVGDVVFFLTSFIPSPVLSKFLFLGWARSTVK